MKRLMFVCLGLNNGGVARVISVLSEALNKEEYKIYILSLSKGIETYSVDDNVIRLYPEDDKSRIKQLSRIKTIRSAIKNNNIDIVLAFSHYNAMYSIIASMGLAVRVIGSERNDPAQLDNRKMLNFFRFLLYRKLDCLVCQTNDAKAYFPESIRKKSVVILNPITNGLPSPYEGERSHRVVSFSRLEPQKNIPMLIQAFKKFRMTHPDYVLDIYGDGSLYDSLLKSIGNDETIRLHSYSTTIHEEIIDARMFVLSSDYEGLSNSMIEAMGCGVPTIVTDCPCGGARMVIKDHVNGILVPVGDSVRMAEEMCRVADDDILAMRLSENGTKIRERLDQKKIAFRWGKIIDRLKK